MLEGIEHLNTARNVVFEREGISRLDIERKYVTASTPQSRRHVALISSGPKKDLFDLVDKELMKQTEEEASMLGNRVPRRTLCCEAAVEEKEARRYLLQSAS